ncbi:2-phosphoglycerate kinase [Anoxybacillus calidus]|uniref:2-phosphoglycerate kinase n=1 Tax=[Anoxybacillus] calidus TaxID=575178 RepID=A0A7V9YX08_9BACL|nr:hypothetical protein [Anoxybacillus calidus]MBA2869973.1 2-phosphoglycerate kinase [Anoxybacillus calidus]
MFVREFLKKSEIIESLGIASSTGTDWFREFDRFLIKQNENDKSPLYHHSTLAKMHMIKSMKDRHLPKDLIEYFLFQMERDQKLAIKYREIERIICQANNERKIYY